MAAVFFTAAGLVTSSIVGATLAILGGYMFEVGLQGVAVGIVLALSILSVLRALTGFRFLLPRVRRQTSESWGKRLRPNAAATLWGLDLGTTISTRFTFTGLSILVGSTVALGDPTFGAALFASFWFARALPVWLGPTLLAGSTVVDLVAAVDRQRALFRRINTLGVTFATVVLIVCFSMQSTSY